MVGMLGSMILLRMTNQCLWRMLGSGDQSSMCFALRPSIIGRIQENVKINIFLF